MTSFAALAAGIATPAPAPTPAPQPAPAPVAEKKVVRSSSLLKAIEARSSMKVDELVEGLKSLELSEEQKAGLIEVAARTVLTGTAAVGHQKSLMPVLQALESPELVAAVLDAIARKKDKRYLVVDVVAARRAEVAALIAPGLEGDALDEALRAVNLFYLKPAPDMTAEVKAAVDEKQSAEQILKLVESKIHPELNLSYLLPLAVQAGCTTIFADPKQPSLEAVSSAAPLWRRVVAGDYDQMLLVYHLQKAWFQAKASATSLYDIVSLLVKEAIVTKEGLQAWKSNLDLLSKFPGKPAASVHINKVLTELTKKA